MAARSRSITAKKIQISTDLLKKISASAKEFATAVALDFMEWAAGEDWQPYDSPQRWINGRRVLTTEQLFKLYEKEAEG